MGKKRVSKTRPISDVVREKNAKFEREEQKITKEFNEAINSFSLTL